ncbi:MAG: glyoxylate/hydroxypyruvate reductase A [Cyclobacteriaceae bacterium]|nr:glyoxylate/hydroxypyruvate reductase A [Cyclobacteriaceae bacterium HetDA_MAG_MS6]
MALVIDSRIKDLNPWVEEFRKYLPDQEVLTWPTDDVEHIDVAVTWYHHRELFTSLPNLKMIASLGAGVDHIVEDASIPDDVYVTRVIHESISWSMSNYCIAAILYHQRRFDKYLLDKQNVVWDQQHPPERDISVGIVGFGVLGQDLGRKLRQLDFEVHGLSMTKKEIDGISTYTFDQMGDFLQRVNVIVGLLPMTPQTKDFFKKDFFDQVTQGSFFINVGRGAQQVDEDILSALNSGQLSGAFLDVFPREPLPGDSGLWGHPRVMITPHIACITKIDIAVPQIVENYNRIGRGEIPLHLADVSRGY